MSSTRQEQSAVVNLTDLAPYQPGSVVSRSILKKASGTITAFSFDAGELLSEHTTPFDAVVIGVDGVGDVTIAGAVHRVAAGQMLSLPGGQPHSVRAVTQFQMLLVMLK
jgi:quercetin dioxygenase-like cupin family protein